MLRTISRSVLVTSRMAGVKALPALANAVSSKFSTTADSLIKVLQDEYNYEKENTSEDLDSIKNSFGEEWTVVDKVGTARFKVVKKFDDGEVTVDVDCTPMPSESENEEGEEAEGGELDGYRVIVTFKNVNKSDVMQIGCFVDEKLNIHRVTLWPVDHAPTADQIFGGFDELPNYAGPNFDELDYKLQDEYHYLLENVGIDNDFACLLADYAASKEQGEYVNFLQRSIDFLK